METRPLGIIARIKGLGDIYSIYAPIDEALTALKQRGIRYPITARDLAFTKIKQESCFKEGALYTQRKPVLFIRNPPIWTETALKETTQASRNGQEYFFLDTTKYQEQAEADKKKKPEDRRVLILNQRESFEIPTNRFSDEEIPLWFFKDQARSYGDFLNGAGIKGLSIGLVDSNYVDKQENPFIGHLSLKGLGDTFGIKRFSHCHVLGVLKET